MATNLGSFEHFIFDLDGTLIDSAEEILHTLHFAYLKTGIDLNETAPSAFTAKLIGPPLDELMKTLTPHLSAPEKTEILTHFKAAYDSSDYSKTSIYEGASELLQKLDQKKIHAYIATNKRYFPTSRILLLKGLEPFRDVIAPDKMENRKLSKSEMIQFLLEKWSLNPSKVVMIGDTPGDILAARSQGVFSIAMLHGYGEKKLLFDCKPDLVVGNIIELRQLLHTELDFEYRSAEET